MARDREMKYIVVTTKSWDIKVFHEIISKYNGGWSLATNEEELSVELIKSIKPRYIFFIHWSYKISPEILNLSECIGFHETPLPYGRGGSPIQNMIIRRHRKTLITALKMNDTLDAGDIYMQRDLSLDGLAEEIFIRKSYIVAYMIKEIIDKQPTPIPQRGEPIIFKRRKPEQSEFPQEYKSLDELFGFIRMLDADTYPKAFINCGSYRLEFTRPALRVNHIDADVRIYKND